MIADQRWGGEGGISRGRKKSGGDVHRRIILTVLVVSQNTSNFVL